MNTDFTNGDLLKKIFEKTIAIEQQVADLIRIVEKLEVRSDNRFDKHENRIRFLEKMVYMGLGGLLIFEILMKVLK